MIRIPTQGRYAVRAMIDIGLHQEQGPVLRQEIARRQEISANYVAQIFRQLTASELVVSVKGPGGGYSLARNPDQICAGDILRAVEGPFALVHCVLEDDEKPCDRTEKCVTHRLWTRLSRNLEEYLDSVTLQDLIDEACELDPVAPG
ncbi:RrF2 family transcriptional regulator [Candidatus Bipolaricaulota bacterium]